MEDTQTTTRDQIPHLNVALLLRGNLNERKIKNLPTLCAASSLNIPFQFGHPFIISDFIMPALSITTNEKGQQD